MLRQSIDLALGSIIDPASTQVNHTTTVEGLAPRLAANMIARFKDDARKPRAGHQRKDQQDRRQR